jgi:hypothetical protein
MKGKLSSRARWYCSRWRSVCQLLALGDVLVDAEHADHLPSRALRSGTFDVLSQMVCPSGVVCGSS